VIGVDTNVLVRLFVTDDVRQSDAATRFFAERSPDDPAFVSSVVVAELIWLLDDTYGYSQTAIVDVLHQLLASADFVIERSALLSGALDAARRQVIDIADFLIAQIAAEMGCGITVTFDREAARRIPGMELLK
jgi:predicted nucleic-acid-binding protein